MDYLAAVPDAAESGAPAAENPAWRLFRLPERAISALLEEKPGVRKTSILVTSEDRDFDGATVHFKLGKRTGSIVLKADDTGSRWSAREVISGCFADLLGGLPSFTVARL